MALIKWHEGMNVGVPLLDEEHRRIINALNLLYDAIEQSKGITLLSQTLMDLISYTSYHFRHEENLFSHTDYPDKMEHIAKHENMTTNLNEIYRKATLGQTEEISIELMVFLKEWLIDHIQGTDMQYIPYLKKTMLHKD